MANESNEWPCFLTRRLISVIPILSRYWDINHLSTDLSTELQYLIRDQLTCPPPSATRRCRISVCRLWESGNTERWHWPRRRPGRNWACERGIKPPNSTEVPTKPVKIRIRRMMMRRWRIVYVGDDYSADTDKENDFGGLSDGRIDESSEIKDNFEQFPFCVSSPGALKLDILAQSSSRLEFQFSILFFTIRTVVLIFLFSV